MSSASATTVAALCLALASTQAATQEIPTVWDAANRGGTARELICRGGPGFAFRGLGMRPPPGGADQIAVAMTFAAAKRAAGPGNTGLEPGTCAWRDAPLAAGEPREVRFITHLYGQTRFGPLDTSLRAAERWPDVHSIANYLMHPGHYWTFNTRSANGPYFDSVHHTAWVDPRGRPTVDPRDLFKPFVGTGPWAIHAVLSGGIDGRIVRVTLDANGTLQAAHSRSGAQCTVKLGNDTTRAIETLIARARPGQWRKTYDPKGGPCCDMIGSSLKLEREEDGQKRVYETRWTSVPGEKTVPDEIETLFDGVVDARKACAFPL